VNLEEVAGAIRSYDTELVPGLLQTEAYAHTVISTSPFSPPGDVDRLVQARLARQERLTGPDPVEVWAVLSEGALRRQVGGPDVQRAQLIRLRELADRPNITIQISAFDQGALVAAGFPFTLLRLADDELDVVYLEDLTSARYVDNDPHEQERYGVVWNHLARAALQPKASKRMLDILAK
jgi:hypothetical protein